MRRSLGLTLTSTIICFATCAPIAVFADENPDQMTAAQFIALCERDAKWCSHWVTNYYARIMISSPANIFCPSGKEESSEVTEKVVARVRAHQEMLASPAFQAVQLALAEAFPCK
jgi:Rap1a immunity proteins